MPAPREGPPAHSRFLLRLAAWAAHGLTASGAALGLLALERAVAQDFPMVFLWLALALLVDGVDGTIARAARVREHAPEIDGELLDLVVDYLTYVVVPLVAIWQARMMPPAMAAPVLLLAGALSALYFADRRMKTSDHWFRGFPALWNIILLYLFVFPMPGGLVAAVLLALSVLMFAPIVFVHPMRVTRLRTVTLAAGAVWIVCAALVVADGFGGPRPARWGLVLSALYFLLLPAARARGPTAGQGVA